MEGYLQNMKTLRSQMNDVEDQAVKISVEEQTHAATIQTLENDLLSAKSEIKQLKEDTEKMVMEKGQICSQILIKQRKIVSLETDSHTLSQTLELIQHEISNFSVKLIEKSNFYAKTAEELNAKLQEQQEWVSAHKVSVELGEQALVKGKVDEDKGEAEGNFTINNHCSMDNLKLQGNEAKRDLMVKLDSAQVKLNEVTGTKSKLVMENSKMKQCVEQLKRRENGFKDELRAMNIETLEQEHEALLSDKAGETEFLQSLQAQIEKFKGICHVVKCACGNEYKVEVDCHMAQNVHMNIG